MKHIIAYVRVSTEEQARDGVSLDAQRTKIQNWIALNAPDAKVRFFSDEGLSAAGTLSKRPGLWAALEAASQLEEPVFVIYSLSRLSRSTKQTLIAAEHLEKCGCELVSLSERLDTTTAAGKMVFRMFAVLAEFERDQISERTKMGMAQLRLDGKQLGRYATYPDRYAHRAAELRDKGWSYQKVGEQLTKEGYTTHLGAPWQTAMVRRLARRAGSR